MLLLAYLSALRVLLSFSARCLYSSTHRVWLGRMIDPKVFTALLLTSMGAAGTALGAFMVVLHPKASGRNNRTQGGSTNTIARFPSSPCPPWMHCT